MGQIIGLLIASAVLITLSMLFSISESSFLSMNKLRLRVLRKQGNKKAVRVSRLLEKKELLINTLLVANDLVNILLSSIITAVALKLFGQKGVGYATFAVTLLLLVFGEITPKAISTRNPDSIAYTLSLFVSVVERILHPLVYIFTGVSRIVLKIKGIRVNDSKQSYTQEDIKSFIQAGGETGVLGDGEKNMMERVFKFNDLEAQEIMVPRTEIIRIKSNSSYRSILEIAQRTRLSRFPVYDKNIDDIVGVLYLKDLLKTDPEHFEMKRVMRSPIFIPGSKKISSVQQVLMENHQTLAIIIDEYSGTDGLLTQSDIYREIFGTGQINSPWQERTTDENVKTEAEFDISGSTLLIDFKEILGIELKSEINDTLGGFIVEKLDRLAQKGDYIIYSGYKFTVRKVEDRRIQKVRIKKLSSEVTK
ncbi:MAG: HlyC/CorC family transporter [Treponema sp.]|nr:HlyC/CorC family transporter [Treponema sp.]